MYIIWTKRLHVLARLAKIYAPNKLFDNNDTMYGPAILYVTRAVVMTATTNNITTWHEIIVFPKGKLQSNIQTKRKGLLGCIGA